VAVSSRIAASLNDALDLTPAQIVGMAEALSRLNGGTGSTGGSRDGRRRGTSEEFKAALMGALS